MNQKSAEGTQAEACGYHFQLSIRILNDESTSSMINNKKDSGQAGMTEPEERRLKPAATSE
jgi:hypothetical protein